MLTLNEDHNDLRALLANVGYDGSHAEDENIINAIVAVSLTLESIPLSKEAREIVIALSGWDVMDELSNLPLFGEDAWMKDFDYGNDKVGSIVRVKPDAYDSPSGARHNGLVGVLNSLSGHRAEVRYIGLGAGNSMKHSKENLQSLRHGVK
jgi:hypothetical protein